MSQAFAIKRYLPFSYKMMIPYLLLVLLTDAIIGYLSYSMLIQSRTEIAETNIRTAMAQTRNNFRYQMDEIERISDTLFDNVNYQRALQKTGTPLEIYLTMLDEIVPQMRAPLQLFANPIRLVLYKTNDDLYEIEGDDLSKPIKSSDYYVLSARQIASAGWPTAANSSGSWMQVDSDRALGNVSHVRRLVSFYDNTTTIGYLRITAKLDDLLGNYDSVPVGNGIVLRLIDESSSSVLYQRGAADDRPLQPNSFLTLTMPIPNTSDVIEMLVPNDYLRKDARKLQSLIFAVCSISFLVMAFIGGIVARLSGRKMRRIVGLVRSFQDGSFEKRIRFGGNDEFVQIAGAFNKMAANIQELINRVYVQDVRRKQAELEALQAQINPHFLYNTLSTISSLANMGQTRQVTEMVRGLSSFYRLSLNEGLSYIPLRKELEQVETYLDIQRVKYADSFSVYVDVEPAILDAEVVKLILQPFVENVFKHAWFEETIAIRITGRRIGERIELKVIDNGVGMKPERARAMLEGPSSSGGYGVKNVDERIKLRYGNEYGIELASIYGAGTTVRILLPAAGRNDGNDGNEGTGKNDVVDGTDGHAPVQTETRTIVDERRGA